MSKIQVFVFKNKMAGDLALELFSPEFFSLEIGDEILLYENQGVYILVDVFEKEIKEVK